MNDIIRRPFALAAFIVGVLACAPVVANAQSGPAAAPNLVVPTVKVLAIGSFTAKATPDAWKPLLASEVRETVELYLAGKIDQWYVKQDQSGVVFMMNLADPAEAHAILEKLPFGQAKMMEFQFIPLGPISPLRLLLTSQPK